MRQSAYLGFNPIMTDNCADNYTQSVIYHGGYHDFLFVPDDRLTS